MTGGTHSDVQPPRLVGPYRLESKIGGTSGSEVWAARRNDERGMRVAVKLLPAGDDSPLATFRDEARAAQSLTHPGLVSIYEIGESDRGLFVAMELIDGLSLAQLVERLSAHKQRLAPRVVVHIGIRVAEVLSYALTHAALDGLSIKLFHRHLSPHDVLIDSIGHVRLADLGIAASVLSARGERTLRGHPEYLSPEQIRGDATDERSDLFSLGAVMYYAATGLSPFAAGDADRALAAVLDRHVMPVHELAPGFPRRVSDAIERCLSKDPAARFASTQHLRTELVQAATDIGGLEEARQELSRLMAEHKPGRRIDSARAEVAPAKAFQVRPPIPKREDSAAATIAEPKKPAPPPALGENETVRAAPVISRPPVQPQIQPAEATEAGPLAPPPPAPAPVVQAETRAPSTLPKKPVPIIAPRIEDGPARRLMLWLSDQLEDPEARPRLVGGAAIAVLALIGLLWVIGPSSRHDDALRAAYEGGDWTAAEAYFVEHMGDFKYPESAFDLATNARLRRLGLPLEAVVAGVGAEEDQEEPEEVVPSEAPPEPPVLPPETAPAGAAPVAIEIPSRIPDSGPRSKAERKAQAQARKLEQSGARAVELGDLDAAAKNFRRCLEIRELPSCHLRLALALEARREPVLAADHFERYLVLSPEAPQQLEIRERIAIARGQR